MPRKIPYTLKIVLPVIGWTCLCGFFSFVLIVSTAKLSWPSAYFFFLKLVLFFAIILTILALMRNAGLFGGTDIRMINKNIINGNLNPSLSFGEAQKTFYYLVRFCRSNFNMIIWSGLVLAIVLGGVMKFYKNVSDADFLIILAGGVVATVLSAVFASFYSEQATFSVVKAIRKKIIEFKGSVPDINFDSIASKFYFLFIFPIVTTIVVLICVFPFSLNVAVLSLIGMTMILIIDKVLFAYIAKSFFEADGFIKEMHRGAKDIFATGSVDKEFIDLMHNLNAAGQRAWELKQESDTAKGAMEERVKELEEFFDLTVNREMKMVELKKELKNAQEGKEKTNAKEKKL